MRASIQVTGIKRCDKYLGCIKTDGIRRTNYQLLLGSKPDLPMGRIKLRSIGFIVSMEISVSGVNFRHFLLSKDQCGWRERVERQQIIQKDGIYTHTIVIGYR